MTTVYSISLQNPATSTTCICSTHGTLAAAQAGMASLLTDGAAAGLVQYPECTFDVITDSGGYFAYVRKNESYSIQVAFGDTNFPENPLTNSLQTAYMKALIVESLLT